MAPMGRADNRAKLCWMIFVHPTRLHCGRGHRDLKGEKTRAERNNLGVGVRFIIGENDYCVVWVLLARPVSPGTSTDRDQRSQIMPGIGLVNLAVGAWIEHRPAVHQEQILMMPMKEPNVCR